MLILWSSSACRMRKTSNICLSHIPNLLNARIQGYYLRVLYVSAKFTSSPGFSKPHCFSANGRGALVALRSDSVSGTVYYAVQAWYIETEKFESDCFLHDTVVNPYLRGLKRAEPAPVPVAKLLTDTKESV